MFQEHGIVVTSQTQALCLEFKGFKSTKIWVGYNGVFELKNVYDPKAMEGGKFIISRYLSFIQHTLYVCGWFISNDLDYVNLWQAHFFFVKYIQNEKHAVCIFFFKDFKLDEWEVYLYAVITSLQNKD